MVKQQQQQQITNTTQCGNSYSYMSSTKDISDFRTGNKPNWHNLKLPKHLLGMIVNDFDLKSTTPKDILKELLNILYKDNKPRLDELNKEYEFTYGIVEHVQPVKQPVQPNVEIVEIVKSENLIKYEKQFKQLLSDGNFTKQQLYMHLKKYLNKEELQYMTSTYGIL